MSYTTIKTGNGDLRSKIIRAFNLKDSPASVAVLGEEHEDHDVWLVYPGGDAHLIGTLSERTYKKVRRTRNLVLDTSDLDAFEHVEKCFSGKVFEGRVGDIDCAQEYVHQWNWSQKEAASAVMA